MLPENQVNKCFVIPHPYIDLYKRCKSYRDLKTSMIKSILCLICVGWVVPIHELLDDVIMRLCHTGPLKTWCWPCCPTSGFQWTGSPNNKIVRLIIVYNYVENNIKGIKILISDYDTSSITSTSITSAGTDIYRISHSIYDLRPGISLEKWYQLKPIINTPLFLIFVSRIQNKRTAVLKFEGKTAPWGWAETEIHVYWPSGWDSPASKQLFHPGQNTCIRADTLLGIWYLEVFTSGVNQPVQHQQGHAI